MKKLILIVAAVLVGGAAFFAWTRAVSAQSFHTGTNVNLNTEPLNKTVFAAGQTVDIHSDVNGDIFCAGQTVSITGNVHGDVMCAGQNVTISGKVDGDVRLAGQTVIVSAEVTGNATVGGQSFTLESSGKIGGDLSVGASQTTLNGAVGRDIAAGGENVTIASTVGRNLTFGGNDLTLLSTAKVGGNVSYTSNNELQQSTGAVVLGTVTQHEPPKHEAKSKRAALFGFGIAWFLFVLLAFAFAALIASLLFPQLLRSVSEQAVKRPWQTLLVGFVSTIVAPVLLGIIAITIIGIPLAIVAGLAWTLILAVSGLFFAFYVGRLLTNSKEQAVLTMLLGVAALVIAYFVPILGFLVFLASTWFGTGMLVLELFRRTPKPVYETTPASKSKK